MWLQRRALSHDEIIAEFDQWVTPSSGHLRETQKFQSELESLEMAVNGVVSVRLEDDLTHLDALKALVMHHLNVPESASAKSQIAAIINTLFLVTTKSDNAIKCQYPIYFRERYGATYPNLVRRVLCYRGIPDVVKSQDIISVAVRVREVNWDVSLKLILDYISFLLRDEIDRDQFVALIDAYEYIDAQSELSGTDLLAPLVGFQVRGSVAASGGHEPEAALRSYLSSWGLLPDTHYNVRDVVATELNNWLFECQGVDSDRNYLDSGSDKTRAFDFILPYQLADSSSRIFIQSQFYAGDSGSVSHKNVDQASKARLAAANLFPDARFVELVDGAGYCASLRKDLRHLLFAADTDDFVQLKSIPIRLRRMLQESGVISPLDFALIIYRRSTTTLADLFRIERSLTNRIDTRWIEHAIDQKWISISDDKTVSIPPEKVEITRRYNYLERVIESCNSIQEDGEYLLVPGFGPNFGTFFHSGLSGEELDYWLGIGVIKKTIFSNG